ncbi:MAG: restriction endonuclease PLD domain-containing protein [Pseudomonadota bacterium]
MVFSNREGETLSFKNCLSDLFADSEEVNIAVGYVASDTVKEFRKKFIRLANNGGLIRVLVGMAFFEGLSDYKRTLLEELDVELKAISNDNGVYLPYTRRYHGKIYDIVKNSNRRIFVGSANFSNNAFKLNLECSVEVSDKTSQNKVHSYVDYLFSDNVSTSINKTQIPVAGIPAKKAVALHQRSNLNVYFGKGRLSRTTGKIAPRPWYEVELINPVKVTKSPNYPNGNFTLLTSDGYKIPMSTNGDYHKNMRSSGTEKGSLQLLGQWIKGRLQSAGALQQYQPITPETFEIYGKRNLRLYKIDKTTYYTDF